MTNRETERLKRILEGIEHAGDAIGLFELDGTFIYCNRAWKVIHRLDPDSDYTGVDDSVITIPDLRPGIDHVKGELEPGYSLVTRQALEVEGRHRVFQVSVDYVSNGTAPMALVIFRDVTELEEARSDLKDYRDRLEEIVKVRTAELEETNRELASQVEEREAAERSLRESEEYAKTLFKALPVPTFTFRKRGEHFVFEGHNDAAMEMTSGHVADNIGMRVEEYFRDRPRIARDIRRCFEDRKTIEYDMEYRADFTDDIWHLSVKYVFVPPDTVMVHTENITPRVLAERELKENRDSLQDLVGERTAELENANTALVESEQKYRTISEMTSDYTFVTALLPDGSLRREWMAGAFESITGYSKEELEDMLGDLKVVHPDDRERLAGTISLIRGNGPVDPVEFRMVKKGGGEVWVEAVAKPLPPSPEGYPRGMVAVRDVDGRKKAEIELERRNRELTVVNRIREIFDSGSRDRETMDMMLEALLENSEAISAGVCVYDGDSGSIEITGAKNVSEEFLEKYGQSPMLAATAERIIAEDTVAVLQEDAGAETQRAEAMRDYGVFQTIAFPVRLRGSETAIFLIGYGKGRELGIEKMRFFDIVRNQVRLQFERRLLLADREWHEKKLRELTVSLIGILEQERNSMALKLHDELGQEIVAINAQILFLENELQNCEDKPKETLAAIKSQLKELTQNVRKMSYAVHPAVLEDLGLRPALSSYIDRFIESEQLHVDLVTTGFDGKLTGDEALTMYRVAQEALTNVVRHSGASEVTVRIIRGYPDLILSIEDNGEGFTPGSEDARGEGLGLINMRERVEGLGGKFRLQSAPGRGTRIRASIPLEEQDDE